MSDANEIVTIELCKGDRVRLRHAMVMQVVRLYDSLSWESLDLGFEIPAGWPDDEALEILFSQLVVLAKKLKMRIHISELKMTPL